MAGGVGGVEGGNFYRGKSFQTTQHVAQIFFLPNVCHHIMAARVLTPIYCIAQASKGMLLLLVRL